MHKIVSIEGNIGSGKTTLLNNLKEFYKNNDEIIFLRERHILLLLTTKRNYLKIL